MRRSVAEAPVAPTGDNGARGSLTVQAADQAFDGQFFYRIGVSPWSTDGRVAGVQNDLPSLRNARWGYGAAGLGRPAPATRTWCRGR